MKYSKQEKKWIKDHTTEKEREIVKEYLAKKKRKDKKPAPKANSYKITPPDENSTTYRWVHNCRKQLISRQTKFEMEFYSVLDTLNIPYEKQYPFYVNKRIFFADAVFHDTHTVVEIDGGYHNIGSVAKKDAIRTRHINGAGYRVVRITNDEVYDRNLFMSKIEKYIPADIDAYMYVE